MCGHDLQKLLTSAGFVGKFLPWIDPYCVGPLYLNEDKMSVTRAKYVVDNYLSVMTPNEAVCLLISHNLQELIEKWPVLLSDFNCKK